MSTIPALKRADLRILLRIIGSRQGASVEDIAAFHRSHRWPEVTADVVRVVVTRLAALGWVTERDGKYHASAAMQAAFNEACRNCRDTIEEYEILERIVLPGVAPENNDE